MKIWNHDTLKADGLRKLYKAQTKQIILRFFLHQHSINACNFQRLPWQILSWMQKGSGTEMYPCDGQAPNGRELTSWKRSNCPWYLEFNGWNTFSSEEEKLALEAIQRGEEPHVPTILLDISAPEEEEAAEFDSRIPLDPQYDGKVSRMEVSRAPKKNVHTLSEGSVAFKGQPIPLTLGRDFTAQTPDTPNTPAVTRVPTRNPPEVFPTPDTPRFSSAGMLDYSLLDAFLADLSEIS